MTEEQPSDLSAVMNSYLTENDAQENSTVQSLDTLGEQIERLFGEKDAIDTVLDLGCGGGGFAVAIATVLDADSVYGVELDDEKAEAAEKRGMSVSRIDLEREPLPYDDDEIDLVVSFGLFEHLRYYDPVFSETQRVLRSDGWFWSSVPNLGSWINRLTLLFGYQPRSVEISNERAFGIHESYPSDDPLGHVHPPTYRAYNEALTHYGFEIVDTSGLHPYQRGRAVRLMDAVFGWRPSLARRFAVLATNSDKIS